MQFINLKPGDKRRLWSLNSTSGPGKYVYLTDENVTGGSPNNYVVRATGDDEGKTKAETVITVADETPEEQFKLKFQKDGTPYYLDASETSVVASPSNSDTWFKVKELLSPNQPCVVLQSNKKDKNGPLYLSSDGAGNMKLKRGNLEGVKYMDDKDLYDVDPALLFRVVRIIGEK